MRKIMLIIAFFIVFAMLAGCSKSGGSIVVGAKDYTEQFVLGNILTLLIEKNTNLTVSLITDMSSDVIFAGITTGAIDLYVEYTGTAYSNHLKLYTGNADDGETRSAEEIFNFTKEILRENFSILMMDKLGFNNTYIMAVKSDKAAEHNLRTISDLASVSSNYIFGGSSEILSRNDGIPNLKIVYDMDFKDIKVLDGVDRYIAIANDDVQITEAFSTDGMLLEYELAILDDDKQFFPPYHAAIVIREEIAEEHPELMEVLEKLSGLLTDDVMRTLNHKVDVLGMEPKEVAEGFLRVNNLIR